MTRGILDLSKVDTNLQILTSKTTDENPRRAPTSIFWPTSTDKHLLTDEHPDEHRQAFFDRRESPTSTTSIFDRRAPTSIFWPTSTNKHILTDEHPPTSTDKHFLTDEHPRRAPTSIFWPKSTAFMYESPPAPLPFPGETASFRKAKQNFILKW